MKKHIPTFKSEAEERRFWQTHDSTEYVDWSQAEEVLMPKLRPTIATVLTIMNIIAGLMRDGIGYLTEFGNMHQVTVMLPLTLCAPASLLLFMRSDAPKGNPEQAPAFRGASNPGGHICHTT